MVTHIRIEVRLHRGCFIEDGEELPGKPTDELSQEQNAQHLNHLHLDDDENSLLLLLIIEFDPILFVHITWLLDLAVRELSESDNVRIFQ